MGSAKKPVVFFEAGKWYHRVKLLTKDGSTKYSKKGGFASAEEAEKSWQKYDEDYRRAHRAYHAQADTDFSLEEYLEFWREDIYSERVENTSNMLAAYVVQDLLLPNMDQGIRLSQVSTEYLDALLQRASKCCTSAGNKCRELLNIALKDAVEQGYIRRNPVQGTKVYPRKKPTIQILDKKGICLLLKNGHGTNWYLEILLGLFMGLRKGEISGLKFTDINPDTRELCVSRQVTADPIMGKGQDSMITYGMAERGLKTEKSFRILNVPGQIMEELDKRKALVETRKQILGTGYEDHGYVSCRENGKPHAASAFNTALTKLCSRSGLPHITVHGLRHMYATILLEQGVPLVKVSALLGHSSIHTTFEYYCDVMDEQERIMGFMNDTFPMDGGSS